MVKEALRTELPNDWKALGLGNYAQIYRGGSPRPIQNYLTTSDTGVNWIKIGDVSTDAKYITATEEKIIPEGIARSRMVYKGDLILSNSMSYGRPYILNIEGCIHDGWLVIQKYDKTFDRGYLYYALSSDQTMQQYISMAAGSSVQNLNKEKVSKVVIPCPPIQEQRKIADILSDIDTLITNLQKLIRKKKDIRQGTMQMLLTGKNRLQGFSSEWKDTALGKICDIKDGTHQTPHYVESGIPFYSVETVTNDDFTHVKYISLEEHERLTSSYKIDNGDVLMTRIGSIGKGKYVDWSPNASFYVSLALLKFRGNKPLANFIALLTDTEEFQKEAELHSLQFAIPMKINLGQISDIRVRIPTDQKEIKAIIAVLNDMGSEIKRLKQKLNKYKYLKQGMMEELLTGKVRLV